MCFQKWSIFRFCPKQILRLFFGKLNGIWMGFTVVVWLMVLGRHNWLWSSSYQSGAKKSLLGSTDTLSTVLPTITTSEQEKVLFIYIKKISYFFAIFSFLAISVISGIFSFSEKFAGKVGQNLLLSSITDLTSILRFSFTFFFVIKIQNSNFSQIWVWIFRIFGLNFEILVTSFLKEKFE